jgi:hypothetical protein
VNLLRSVQTDIAIACAGGSPQEERVGDQGWRFESQNGIPYLAEAQAVLIDDLDALRDRTRMVPPRLTLTLFRGLKRPWFSRR